MRHLLIGIFCCSLILATGCQTGSGPFGASATQIPPPPTGAANRNDPYYQPNGNSIGRSNRDPSYTARNNRRARISSNDESSTRGSSRDFRNDDQGLLEPEPYDDSTSAIPREMPTDDLGPSSVTLNDELPWSRPSEALVSPASAYESSRPRPRFGSSTWE
ncbi:hypothetical protein ACFL2H_05420 [Planctomycetota bacterium]